MELLGCKHKPNPNFNGNTYSTRFLFLKNHVGNSLTLSVSKQHASRLMYSCQSWDEIYNIFYTICFPKLHKNGANYL